MLVSQLCDPRQVLHFHGRSTGRLAPDYFSATVDLSIKIGEIDWVVVVDLHTETAKVRMCEIAHRRVGCVGMRMPSPALRNGSTAIACAAWPEGTRKVLAPCSSAVSLVSSVRVVGVP